MRPSFPNAIPTGSTRILGPLALAVLLASLGVSIATVALPTLARHFLAPVSQVQWVILAYLLSITVVIVSAARLGDLLGHGRVLLAGIGVFTVASAICATAPTLGVLIAARAGQGVGGAILMAVPVAIIRDMVARERMGAAMGLMGTMSAIGTALGPSVGGLVIAWAGWRWSFLLLAMLGAALFVLALRWVPAMRAAGPSTWRGLDVPGALVLAFTLAAYSLAATGALGAAGPVRALMGLAAAAGLAAFVVIETRQAVPLVQLAVLRDRRIAVSLFANLLVSTVMMSTLVVGPFYLAFALGLDEGLVGLVMAVGPATAALSGVPAGRLTDKAGPRRILGLGLAQTLAGLLCFAVLPGQVGVAGYVLSLMLLTPGFQLFLAANNTGVMMAAPEDQRGMISGLLGLSRNLGFMTGASVMGAVFALAVGTADVARAPAEAVGAAFTTTFLVAAGLTMVAMIVAWADGRVSARRLIAEDGRQQGAA